ncbi:MAG: hypothetical protein CMF80_07415 [Candidatus Marinimicrobia bacterium]|nr:hypothetical protein [Candidatus Neomarinimicrobiota bacterium]
MRNKKNINFASSSSSSSYLQAPNYNSITYYEPEPERYMEIEPEPEPEAEPEPETEDMGFAALIGNVSAIYDFTQQHGRDITSQKDSVMTNGIFGKHGLYLEASDINNDIYYEIYYPNHEFTDEFSVSLWVKLDKKGKNRLFLLSNDQLSLERFKCIEIFTDYKNESLSFGTKIANDASSVSIDFDLSENIIPHKFYNIILTFSIEKENISFYVNGGKVFEYLSKFASPSLLDLHPVTTDTPFTIHSVMFFNKKIIDSEEIATIYNNGTPPSYYTN